MGTGVEAAVLPEILGETVLADSLPFIGEGLGVSEAGAGAAEALGAAGGAEAGAGAASGLAEGAGFLPGMGGEALTAGGVGPGFEAATAAAPATPTATVSPTGGGASAYAPAGGEGAPAAADEPWGVNQRSVDRLANAEGVTPAPLPAPTGPVPGATPFDPSIPTAATGDPLAYGGNPLVPQVSAPSLPPGAGSAVQKALKALGITDETGGLGKNALPMAGLGLNALAQRRMGDTLSRSLGQAGQRSGSAADTLLQQGLSGQAPQAVVAQANQTYQDTVEKIKQQYANMGRDPRTDTGAIAAMNRAAVARDAQIQQYAQGLTSQGLQAAQIAQTPATQAAMAAAQQDQQLMAAQREVLDRLSKLQAATPA